MGDQAALLVALWFESRWLNSRGSSTILAAANLADASSLCNLPFFSWLPGCCCFPLCSPAYTHWFTIPGKLMETAIWEQSSRRQTRHDEQAGFQSRKSIIVKSIPFALSFLQTLQAHSARDWAGPRPQRGGPALSSTHNPPSPCVTKWILG